MWTSPTPSPAASRAPSAASDPDTRRQREKGRGQSMAEFALTVPMLLLMVLFGLDFGRVFLGWVALNQAAREAASYAAMNPTAWTVPYNLAVQAEYERLVETEAAEINCALESPIPAPTFGDGTSIGAPATVELTCDFDLITPFIGLLTGNPIPVTALSAFPIRSGYIENVPLETAVPTSTANETSTPTPTSTLDPSATVGPTPTPEPTLAPGECKVISLLNTSTNRAATKWRNAGFTGPVIFSPLVPPHYRIAWQSLTVDSRTLCTSGITVRSGAP